MSQQLVEDMQDTQDAQVLKVVEGVAHAGPSLSADPSTFAPQCSPDKTASYSESYDEYLKYKQWKENRKAYYKKWSQKNQERLRAYRASRREKHNAQMRSYYHSGNGKLHRSTPEYKEYHKKMQRKYYQKIKAIKVEIKKEMEDENNNSAKNFVVETDNGCSIQTASLQDSGI